MSKYPVPPASDSDFWVIVPNQLLAADNSATQVMPSRKVLFFQDVTPLDGQLGQWPKTTVPYSLTAALFGKVPQEITNGIVQDSPQPLHSYALLDAAAMPMLPELLEVSSLDWCCLFKGRAKDELRQVAPYLVTLREGDDFVRKLFTNSGRASDMWNQLSGVFLRSFQPAEVLLRQFRRFTRIQDEAGKWYYFRFWTTAALDHAASVYGAELSSSLWKDCHVIWRSDFDTAQACFSMI